MKDGHEELRELTIHRPDPADRGESSSACDVDNALDNTWSVSADDAATYAPKGPAKEPEKEDKSHVLNVASSLHVSLKTELRLLDDAGGEYHAVEAVETGQFCGVRTSGNFVNICLQLQRPSLSLKI